jgi:hypothetical protein
MAVVGANPNLNTRKRGSLTDVITLKSYSFYYEPSVRDTEQTGYASRAIIGNRLPSKLWVGKGESVVGLEVFLLDQSTMQTQLDNFRNLVQPQTDIGAPHPVYLNIGGMFSGRWFVLEEFINDPVNFKWDDTMTPYECRIKLKFCEIPVNKNYVGTGERK